MFKQKLLGLCLIIIGGMTLLISNDATAFIFVSLFFGLPLIFAENDYTK